MGIVLMIPRTSFTSFFLYKSSMIPQKLPAFIPKSSAHQSTGNTEPQGPASLRVKAHTALPLLLNVRGFLRWLLWFEIANFFCGFARQASLGWGNPHAPNPCDALLLTREFKVGS